MPFPALSLRHVGGSPRSRGLMRSPNKVTCLQAVDIVEELHSRLGAGFYATDWAVLRLRASVSQDHCHLSTLPQEQVQQTCSLKELLLPLALRVEWEKFPASGSRARPNYSVFTVHPEHLNHKIVKSWRKATLEPAQQFANLAKACSGKPGVIIFGQQFSVSFLSTPERPAMAKI